LTFTFGRDFRFTVFGESHGEYVGVLIDGCPAGTAISEGEVQRELERRRPGKGGASARKEEDQVRLISGIFNGRANGGPIVAIIANKDVDSLWYARNRSIPRPGHADYTARIKYAGFNDWRGGGFFSGRMTAGIVVAGALAKKLLVAKGVRVMAHLVQMGGVRAGGDVTDKDIEELAARSPVWCASSEGSERMAAELKKIAAMGDSLGGVVECRVLGVPAGVGEPLFDSAESVISHGLFSIPAVKGLEFGGGFGLSGMKGSEANDEFCIKDGAISAKTNNCGGILGGITDGMPLRIRVAFKPTPSIGRAQKSVDLSKMEEVEVRIEGRHDPCVAVRAVPVVEAMVAACIADLMIRSQKIARTGGD
jgi:chorismate synthase